MMGIAGVILVVGGIIRSEYVTKVGVAPEHRVPFSHEHHVGGLAASIAAIATGRLKLPPMPDSRRRILA